MAFDNIYQTGNQSAGGWRFPFTGRQSSVDALYKPQGIDPEFLKKVAGLIPDDKKGLLDQALEDKPLTGLLEYGGIGNDRDQSNTRGDSGASMTPGGNHAVNVSPGGMSLGFNPKAGGLGMLSGGLLGALNGVTATPQAPVFDVALPGFNGFGIHSGNYGTDPAANGPPSEAQAQALADAFAASLAGYEGGLLGGYGRDGSAGTNGVDGYGGFGGTDTSGGYGNNGGW